MWGNWVLERISSWFETRIDPFRQPSSDQLNAGQFSALWSFVRQAKGAFFALLILGIATGVIEVALFIFVGMLVDLLTENTPNSLLEQADLTFWTIGLTVLFIRPTLMILSSLIGEQSIQANFSPLIRWQVHRRVMSQSLSFFQSDFSGNIASKTWQSGQAAAEVIGTALQIVWSNIVYCLSVVMLMSWLDLRLSLIVVLWITLFSYIAYIFVPLTRKRSRSSAEASNSVNGHLVDVYSNAQTVKIFSSLATEESYLRTSLAHFIDQSKRFLRIITGGKAALVMLSSTFITALGVTTVYLWVGGQLTAGQVALILGLVLRLDAQMSVLLGLLTNLFRSFGTFQSSMEMASKPLSLQDREGAKALRLEKGRILFDEVSFGYHCERPVIKNLSLTIEPGEKVGLVGSSGSGKSTIANLLLRLYDVDRGRITIDGQDIRDVTQETLRAYVGLVAQDTSLLHRSVFDNISLGKDGVTVPEVWKAARHAQALEFIQNLRDAKGRSGFDAFVGERGLQLSGGQRQRIAIARVLLKNPPILILDEATSALDAKLDADIQEALVKAMQGRTVLVIAHRLSTVASMDRILVMQDGCIVEQGTHSALLAYGGIYAELWNKQFSSQTFADVQPAAV